MFFDYCNDPALRLFDPDAPKLGNGLAMIQLHEVHIGKALPKAGHVLRPATIHDDDLERRGILLREHGGDAVVDERRSNDRRDDDRNDGWRAHKEILTLTPETAGLGCLTIGGERRAVRHAEIVITSPPGGRGICFLRFPAKSRFLPA